jgi:hypothetical protein
MKKEDEIQLSEEELALARRGKALIKAEVARTQAPLALRERIEADRTRPVREPRLPFWRRHRVMTLATGGAGALVVVLAVVVLQAGGGDGEPSLSTVDAVAVLSPAEGAPASLGGDPPVLAAQVAPIDFPDWRDKFDWRAVGLREDEVSDRAVTTVFYRNQGGSQLAYSIVAGTPLRERPTGEEVVRDGNSYHVADSGPRTVVTWTQQGHTCVIVASSKVPSSTLVDLAASRNA